MTDTYQLTPEELESIREMAYGKFVERGCEDGHDVEDWLSAEQQVRQVRDRETVDIKSSEVRTPSTSKPRERAVAVSKRTKK